MGNVLIATDWLAACAGCHMSLLDLDERLVELLYHVTFEFADEVAMNQRS
jgi:NAD-reducing hydrogenase small subunit